MEQSRLADGSDIIASNALLEDSPPYTAHPRAVGDQASGYHSDSDETEGGLQAGHVPVRSSVSDILSTWWLECLCAVLVVLALFALVFTLYSYQGRPLPHWPHQISINSLVALFVVILKAAMLLIITEGLSQLKWTWFAKPRPLQHLSSFDLASRGPWGAVRFIWTLGGRHVVATTGALVIILALLLDPVTQLVVRYYTCTIQLPNMSANIPRTNVFSQMGSHIGAGLSTLPMAYQSAITAGLFNPDSISIPFDCPTGNCTFSDTYHTLAYCSSCVDSTSNVTDLVGYVNHTMSLGNCTSFMEPSDPNEAPYQCNFTLPDGGPDNLVNETGIEYFTMQVSDSSNAVEMIGSNLRHVYRGNCTTAQENATWACSGGIGAATCSLSPCIRSYQAKVNNGKLEETFVGSTQEFGEAMEAMSSETIDIGCLSPAERRSLINIGYQINETTQWLAYQGNGTWGNATGQDFNASIPNATISDKCVYSYYAPTMMSLAYFMQTFFSGSIYMTPGSYVYDTSGSVQLQQIFKEGNVSFASVNTSFASIADSMTAYIRQNGNGAPVDGIADLNSTQQAPAQGQVFQVETCIKVQWPYLVLPAALVVLTLFFFAAMVVETRKSLDWRSSPLALLFHGLRPDTRAVATVQSGGKELATLPDMTALAEKLQVCLRDTDGGWAFTHTGK